MVPDPYAPHPGVYNSDKVVIVKEKFLQIRDEWEAIPDIASREFSDSYIFSRNAPEGSFEDSLLNELVVAKEALDQIPRWKLSDRRAAKIVLDEIVGKVYKAHQDFIDRGNLYITLDGEIIK